MIQISQAAQEAAVSIGNYCSTRFVSHNGESVPEVHPMMDVPWFADAIQKAMDKYPPELPETLRALISYAMSCKKVNQREWMKEFANIINAALEATGSESRVTWPRGAFATEFQLELG